MANLPTRQQQQQSNRYLDPWRDFFNVESFFTKGWPGLAPTATLPAVNVSEDEKSYIVEVIAPGMKKEDFKINVADDMLTISAESRKEMAEKDDNQRQFSRREYVYSSFTRSFRLPENTKEDSITANYEDGVLRITIPKAEKEQSAAKQINVS